MKVDEKFERIDDEDIDDVIGIAAELMQQDDDALDRAQMVAVGRDLDIPEDYLDRAYAELERRRKVERRKRRREEGRKRRLLTLGGTGLAGVIAVLVFWGMFTLSGLSKQHAEVELRRSQVATVMERKKEVTQRWGPRPDSPDKMAALDGADNRIAVEARRYSEAATEYNARAQRFPATLFLSLSDLPGSVPVEPNRL